MARSASAIVVLYNTSCSESPTCRALQQLSLPVPVLIYDNSTRDMGNRAQCEALGWTYLGGEGNLGLSKAYNACIDYLKSQNFKGFLCLFDDDTQLTPDYFDLLFAAAENTGNKLFVPLLYSGGTLLSPCRLSRWGVTKAFSDEISALTYEGKDLTAINSGMAIDFSLFKHYRYDENIFLDGIDHQFIRDMVSAGQKLSAFSYRCYHAFSGNELPPKSSAVTRFRIFANDQRYILRNRKATYCFLVGKRALRLCLQYRTLEFLRFV